MASRIHAWPYRSPAGVSSRSTSRQRVPAGAVLCGTLWWVFVASSNPATQAQEAPPKPKGELSGGFVTISSPITSATVHGVKRQCERLLNEGARVILFDIQSGTSDYGNCLNLAQYIESINGATTVAFVRQPLSGHAVMVALAAGELVMSSNAALGDIGRDEKFIGPGMATEYAELARRRKPAYAPLILGMLDKNLRVWKLVTARGTRYALDQDLKQLEAQEQVKSKQTVIEVGQLGNFTGGELREIGLSRLSAETPSEVAEFYGLPPKVALETARLGVEWRPVLVRIEGFISPILKEYVIRHVKASMERGKNFFIFQIDSYGGFAQPGMELAHFIRQLEGVKTVAYIPEKAISAAAFIALGCDEIIMHRDAKLGDCGVLFLEGGEFHYAPEKQVSIVRADLRVLAESKLYPVPLAEGMVDKDLVVHEVRERATGRVKYVSDQDLAKAQDVWDNLRVVKAKGEFLTMTGVQALDLDFARDLVDNYEGLCAIYGLESGEVQVVTPNWVDTLIWLLNLRIISLLLIVGGILGLYLELKLPGVAFPGIFAAVCFMLFFWSNFMGGTADVLEILLFLGGLACLAVEILVLPGFGVFGFSGIVMMVSSIILASQTFYFPQGSREWEELALNLGSVVLAFVCLFYFAYLVGRYLPEMPLLHRVVLQPDPAGARYDEAGIEAAALHDWIGVEGVALTTLRPAGRARIGDRLLDVVTDGSYIDEGARVRVIEVSGNRVVVKEVV